MTRYLLAFVIIISLSACDKDLRDVLSTPITDVIVADLVDNKSVVEKSGVYLRSNKQVCLYKNYLNEPANKAFYVTDSAGYGWAADRVSESVALEDALGYCKKSNSRKKCVLFDLNGKIQVPSQAINFDIDCCKHTCSDNDDNPDQKAYSKQKLEGMEKLGSSYALFMIGKSYLYGTNGYEQNPAKAIEKLTLASDKGSHYAMAWLGYIYDEGLGVEKNPRKAKEWYTLAAKNGSDYAKEWLKNNNSAP